MTSENIDFDDCLEDEDDISLEDIHDDSDSSKDFSCQYENESQHSFKGSDEDYDFLAIWGNSSSGSIGIIGNLSKGFDMIPSNNSDDEDLSEIEDDLNENYGYSSCQYENESQHSSKGSDENDDFLAIWENSSSGSIGMINNLSKGFDMIPSSNSDDEDLSESEDDLNENCGYSSDEMLSEDSESISCFSETDFSELKDKELSHRNDFLRNKENKKSIRMENNFGKFSVEAPTQISRSFSVNCQQTGNPLRKEHIAFSMDTKQDERSIDSDKTQKVRNTSARLKSASKIDCPYSCQEEWDANCIVPMLVASSTKNTPQSLAEKGFASDDSVSLLSKYKPPHCDIMLIRSKNNRLFYLCVTIGLLTTATIVYIGTFIGLETLNENASNSKYETQEMPPPSASPTISLLLSSSVRKNDV